MQSRVSVEFEMLMLLTGLLRNLENGEEKYNLMGLGLFGVL